MAPGVAALNNESTLIAISLMRGKRLRNSLSWNYNFFLWQQSSHEAAGQQAKHEKSQENIEMWHVLKIQFDDYGAVTGPGEIIEIWRPESIASAWVERLCEK